MNDQTKIVLYKIEGCGLCNMLKMQLEAKNIPFETVVGEDKIKELGFTSAPVLKVGEEYFHGKPAFLKVKELAKK